MMDDALDDIVNEIVPLGNHLKDVLILLKYENTDVGYRICALTSDITAWAGECRTYLAPNIYDLKTYNDQAQFGGFFENMEKDGIILYDSAGT